MPHVLEIFALFMFLGIFTTLCIPETARVTLEVLAGEDEASEAQLAQSGGIMARFAGKKATKAEISEETKEAGLENKSL